MTVYNWPDDFEWPYAGQPRTVPPDFKQRMVRVQDQIYWLLNAIYKLNAGAISEGAAEGIADDASSQAEDRAKAYASALFDSVTAELEDLYERVGALNMQISTTRNPVTGMNDYTYVALTQLYDILRPHSMTWDELDGSGMTWSELDGRGLTWYQVDVNGRAALLGDDTERIIVTPAGHITTLTPGYVPALFVNGHSWDELDEHGFMYVRNA